MLDVEAVKRDLRISHTRLDDDIKSTVASAKLDLAMAGVSGQKDDALVDTAIKLYCRWHYGFSGKPEQYERAYTSLKQALSLCGDYSGGHSDV